MKNKNNKISLHFAIKIYLFQVMTNSHHQGICLIQISNIQHQINKLIIIITYSKNII